MTKPAIYYWHDWINRSEFQNDPVIMIKINQILRNEAGVKVKRMVNLPIYKTELNYTDRLYWTTKTIHGKPYMVMLGTVINHDYDLNIFKPGELDKFLLRNESLLFAEALALENPAAAQISPSKQPWDFRRPRYYQQQFITLNDYQLQALETSKKCVVISGPAGSGKSCLLFDALRKMLILRGDSRNEPILYVAKSAKLAADLKAMWGIEQGHHGVLFMGYDELVTYLNPDYLAIHRVGEEACLLWLDRYIKQQVHTSSTLFNWLSDECHKNKNILKAVYEEFRVISGYAKTPSGIKIEDDYFIESTYINLGIKQSLFDKEVRASLFHLYLTYLRSLSAEQWDPAFLDIKCRAQFYGIAVDEALDLSLLQLISLYTLSTESNIYYAMDSHQRQNDRRSHRPLLLDILKRLYPETLHAQLSGSYRCPNEMIRVSNGLIQLKIDLAGKTADCFEDRAIAVSVDPEQEHGEFFFIKPMQGYTLSLISVPASETELPKPTVDKPALIKWGELYYSYGLNNAIHWGFTPLSQSIMNQALNEVSLDFVKQREIQFSPVYEKIYQHIQQQGGHKPSRFDEAVLHDVFPSTNCVVLTRKERLVEASRRYPTSLILTPSDIKGLEYDDVICYRLFDDDEKIGENINRQLDNLAQGAMPQLHDQFDLFLNDIIIAITRAKKRVFFVQGNEHHVRHVIPKLQDCLVHKRDLLTSILQHRTNRPTEHDWLEHAAVLLKNGNENVAKSIFHQELGKTSEDFAAFKTAQLPVPSLQIPKSESAKKQHTPQNIFKPIHSDSSTPLSCSSSIVEACANANTISHSPNKLPEFQLSSISSPIMKRTLQETADLLLKNFSTENLTAWFKSPKGVSYLSRIAGNNICLLEHILSCPERAEVFCDLLKKSTLSSNGIDLIKQIADQSYPPNQSSAMHLAASVDCVELINIFSAHCMDVGSGNKHRETPLYIAFKTKHHNAINALIKVKAELFFTGDMNPNQEPFGIFYTAVNYDLTDVIEQMDATPATNTMSTWTNPDIFQIEGATPLVIAVQRRCTSTAFKLITQTTVDLNQTFGEYAAPVLSMAVQNGDFEMVQLLLDHHAPVDLPLINGATPLILAAQFGYLDITCLLIKREADVDWQADDGSTALMHATNFGHHEIASALDDPLLLTWS